MAQSNATTGQPLFIIDKDWLRGGAKPRKSWTGSVRNRTLYGLQIEASEHDIQPSKARNTRKSRRKRHLETSGEDKEEQGSEIPANAQIPSQHVSREVFTSMSKTCFVQTPPQSKPATWTLDRNQDAVHPHLRSISLLGVVSGWESISGYEEYLDYYLDVIGTEQHPLESRMCQSSNAIRSSWFPLAFEDELWLKNIVLFSVIHHANTRNVRISQQVAALWSSFLSLLNERISKLDLSDATIASVSCLALGEVLKGRQSEARVHAAGLAEMVRLRGGLNTIEPSRRLKIVRADIVRSSDAMDHPLLPRMGNDAIIGPDHGPSNSKMFYTMSHLAGGKVSGSIMSAFWSLGRICEKLEAGWKGTEDLDTTTYYEGVLSLSHDLLSMQSKTPNDEPLRLSMLGFIQPMFRTNCFSTSSCSIRSAQLKASLENTNHAQFNADLEFWILFNGFMLSQQAVESVWFRARLEEALASRYVPEVGAWESVRSILGNVLWTQTIHEPFGQIAYDCLNQ